MPAPVGEAMCRTVFRKYFTDKLTQQTIAECVLWAPQAVSGAAKQFFCMRSACKRPDLSPAVT